MASWDHIAHNVRDTLDHVAEGWQELWQKARHAITPFTPSGDSSTLPAKRTSWGVLSAEMKETENALQLSIEAPGMESGDFNVRVEGQVVYVSGTKSYSSQRDEGHFHITERAYGSFQRAIALPCDVDDAKSEASYKHGVLEISLPKTRAAQPRRIAVTVDQ